MSGLHATLQRCRNIPRRFSPRFKGAFPDRETALASLPVARRQGYDDPSVAPVAFEMMCRVAPWDYPVLYWLKSLHQPGLQVVDAGGHLGTKFIAFEKYLALADLRWTVLDLPGIVDVAHRWQADGKLPDAVRFCPDAADAGKPDVLLASGLMQYIDKSLAEFIAGMSARPRHVILNKVAVRDGASVVTLEQIGPNRVPYQIRDRQAFEDEIAAAGYVIRDRWDIPEISHRIPFHRKLGASQSVGYCLKAV